MYEDKNWKPSSYTLTFFVSILTIVSLFFTLFKDNEIQFKKEHLSKVLWIIIGSFIISLIINYKKVNRHINKIISKIYIFIHIVIKIRRGHLEFLDPYGVKAMYYEECLFTRIRMKEGYSSHIQVDGQIDYEVHTYNCHNSLNHKKNGITISYGKKKENIDIIHNKDQLQFGFVVTVLDSFPQKEEFWDTVFKHYTRSYELNLSFFKSNPPKDVDIYEVTYDKSGKEELNRLSVDPLIIIKYGKLIMKVKILHAKKDQRIRVTWNWKKPKKTIKKIKKSYKLL